MLPELNRMRKALKTAVEQWILVLGQRLYVLNRRPISLKSLFQFLRADQSLCLIAQRRANVVIMKYRGVEFYIHQIRDDRWNWHIPTRMEISIRLPALSAGIKKRQ